MSRLYTVFRLGPGVTAAERQASVIYIAGALLAATGIALDRRLAGDLIPLGLACLALAATAWWLPWRRWPPQTTLVLALPMFGLLAWAAGAVGPMRVNPGPFFVLIFAWAGLHHRPAGVLALTPAAVAAYVVPPLADGQPLSHIAFWAVLLLPVMVIVGLVIADRVHRLELTKDRLAHAEQWRASLMLTLAHDVRAPLTAVQTTLEMINENGTLPAAERNRLTELALRQAGRIRRLATGLIDLERIEAGQVRLDRQEIRLRPAIEEALEHAGVSDPVVLVSPADLRVPADPVRLEQVLVNLAGNARRHGQPPIVVHAEQNEQVVRISVRDHGAGLPVGGGKRPFQRFSTADQGPDSVGLGLWAARQLVLAHGGDIRYEPAYPGARFVVTLPAASS